MEHVIVFSSKVKRLLESVSGQCEYSDHWLDQMEVFLPYLSESFFFKLPKLHIDT